MSYLKTRQALVNQIASILPVDRIAWPNSDFDPSGLDYHFAVYFRPNVTESTGKTLASSDLQYGFFQVSVFTERNKNYDNLMLEKIDLVLSGFKNTSSISYEDQIVDILESNVNESSINSSWFQKNITINYLTFSER